ncbi:MAG: alpha/beta hydrolase [Pseudomonadota bacterium]
MTLLSTAEASNFSVERSQHVAATTDGRLLTYHIERRADAAALPILIVIDGSGCVGALRSGFSQLMAPANNPELSYARLVVSKSGVPDDQERGASCSDEYKQHYAMDKRVIDHMRVLQDIRSTLSWWDGRLLIFGWSDGGDIAAQLFAYTPDATRLAFGGVGGGFSMQTHFEDFWICPEGSTDDRAGCLSDLRSQFDEIFQNPTWTKSWSGEDNTYMAWESRLRTRLLPLFIQERRPVLMIHGQEDDDGAPVESARKLVKGVTSTEENQFQYWEVEGMGHGIWSLDPSEALLLETNILKWLLDVDAEPHPRISVD